MHSFYLQHILTRSISPPDKKKKKVEGKLPVRDVKEKSGEEEKKKEKPKAHAPSHAKIRSIGKQNRPECHVITSSMMLISWLKATSLEPRNTRVYPFAYRVPRKRRRHVPPQTQMCPNLMCYCPLAAAGRHLLSVNNGYALCCVGLEMDTPSMAPAKKTPTAPQLGDKYNIKPPVLKRLRY